MVKILDSEDDFEVFNRPKSPEAPTGDFNHLPSAQVSQIQEDFFIPKAMGIQRKPRAGLLGVMESQSRCKALEKTTPVKLPPFPPSLPPWPDPMDNKRKRDQRGPEAMEGGKGPFSKEAEL